MSGSLGSFIIDDTCTFYANSHTPSTGAAVDADAVPGYRVYEDETGTPILTGSMALLDDANTVGFYSEQITLSAANGFEAGKSYCIRITLVVGAVTGIQLQTLQIGARVDVRMVGGSLQSSTDLKDFADTGYDPATHKVQGLVLADTLTTYTGNTPQTGDVYQKVDTEIAAITATLGIAGAGLTALGDTRLANLDAAISSRLASAGYMVPPTVAQIWARLISDMTTPNSIGKYFAFPDPTTTLPGALEDYFDAVSSSFDAVPPLVWARLLSDMATVGSIGAYFKFPDPLTTLPTALEDYFGAVNDQVTILADTDGIEVGLNLRDAIRLIAAACAGKLSGAGTTTITVRNAVADSKNRIVATNDGTDGNRTAVVVDLT